jgi:hypothetical protein
MRVWSSFLINDNDDRDQMFMLILEEAMDEQAFVISVFASGKILILLQQTTSGMSTCRMLCIEVRSPV